MKLQRRQVDQVIRPVHASFRAMREAVATELQWAHVVNAINIADAEATRGPIKGTHGHILAAQQALDGFLRRAMGSGEWDATTQAHLAEIDAISTGIEIYHYQLQHTIRTSAAAPRTTPAAEVRSAGGAQTDPRSTRRRAAGVCRSLKTMSALAIKPDQQVPQ